MGVFGLERVGGRERTDGSRGCGGVFKRGRKQTRDTYSGAPTPGRFRGTRPAGREPALAKRVAPTLAHLLWGTYSGRGIDGRHLLGRL